MRMVSRKRKRERRRIAPPRERKRRILVSPRKRAMVFSKTRQLVRSIVHGISGRDPEKHSHEFVKIGDTVDIFPLLGLGDFLISNPNPNLNAPRHRVRVDDIRGKTILMCLHSLRRSKRHSFDFTWYTRPMIAALEERDLGFEFEVVLVPVNRDDAFFPNGTVNRFHDYFAKVPWLAVPFANKRACDLVRGALHPCDTYFYVFWALIDPSGKVLVTSDYRYAIDLDDYGIGELVPLMHKMLPSLEEKPKSIFHIDSELQSLLHNEDRAVLSGIINLNKLLASPYSDFLLTRDGNKVPISFLKDKVVGLYFCNHASRFRPYDSELINKTYKEIARLGYDFEIVQINHSDCSFQENASCSCCENVPWLKLPFTHSHFKRLIRIFGCRGNALIIINPHECNMRNNYFYESQGIDIIHLFGIEAYPFNRTRVLKMLSERRGEEIKLQLIFGHNPLLLRRGGGGSSYDLVPVSQLWGKRVLLIFATHSKYDPRKFMASLKSKYIEQDGVDVFEVVYVSFDTNASTFDNCTADMPWLVHPYSWEFAHLWVSKICRYYDMHSDSDSDSDGDGDGSEIEYESGSESEIDCESGAWCGMVNFHENGELVSTKDFEYYNVLLEKEDYPFFYSESEDSRFLWDLKYKYGISELYTGPLTKVTFPAIV